MADNNEILKRIRILTDASNLDERYGVWDSIADANANIPESVRKEGLTVGIYVGTNDVKEYWYNRGTEDTDLVLKGVDNSLSKEKLITVSLGDIGASDFEDDIPTKIRAYAISNSITRELNTLYKWKLTENPFEYAENGVTVVLKDGFPAGSSGTGDGDNSGKIYTAVNEVQLKAIINEGDANTDLTGFCTTLVTNMSGTLPGFIVVPFINVDSNQNISSWDVSNVDNMSRMFGETTNFNQPLNNWDVSNVTSMKGMFRDTTSFNQPLNNWDVSNVTDMISMFQNAEAYNQDLSGWCVTNIQGPSGTISILFDTGADAWVLPNSRPIWGTCP